MEDLSPPFLGISKAKPILNCVVRGTQLPSKKGPVGATDLNENHPRSIINPQPSGTGLEGFDHKTANNLFHNYLNHIITQYPIYHRNDVTSAFNSIYYPASVSNPGQDLPRNRYIVSIIMAISLSTAARTKQRAAMAHANSLVRHGMQWLPDVATNDIHGLQAILLLTQYIFLNPSMADVWLLTGLISQAVIDLGLHQELPLGISDYDRDMRRRLFWVAWEMEVAVCSIFSRPINLPTRRYDVAFPVQVDDTAITEEGIDLTGRVTKFTSKRIWLFRQIEAEIISVLQQNDAIPKECASLEHWMSNIVTRILDWHNEVYQAAAENKDPGFNSRWTEMKLYSDIAHPYILLTLYRPSKRIAQPTTENWLTAFLSAVQVADNYWKQSNAEAGAIKYVFHPCHHVFTSAIIFLQALQRCKSEISEKYTFQRVESWMDCFARFFETIAERWPAAKRCLEEYEKLLEPIKKEYLDYVMQKTNHISQQSPILGNVVDGLYNYPSTTDLDGALSFWSTFNPATTADTLNSLDAFSYNVPNDWNTEFNFNFSFSGMDEIPEE